MSINKKNGSIAVELLHNNILAYKFVLLIEFQNIFTIFLCQMS